MKTVQKPYKATLFELVDKPIFRTKALT